MASVLLTAGTNAMATDGIGNNRSPVNNFPPNKYLLSDLEIKFTRHAGMIKGSTKKQIIISGNGSSIIELKGKEQPFKYSSTEIVSLINSFYKIRFFDLPTHYNTSFSVFLNNDGSVGTKALRMMDSANTTICFSLPNFEKCVTYSKDKPFELENIIQTIFEGTESEIK